MTGIPSRNLAQPDAAQGDPGTAGAPRHRLAGERLRKLLAELGALFRNRRQQRAGLYLPLVGMDRGE